SGDTQPIENTTAAGGSSDIGELEEFFELRFPINGDTLKKYEEAKMLLSNKAPKGVSLATLFEECLDAFLIPSANRNTRVSGCFDWRLVSPARLR
ncbi:hypothetical protein OAO01_05845, partial [Oligoflexia bacterium]|nr:hypothetical protein [Oligoflexia bacterium]